MGEPDGLRERKKRQTRRTIARTALRLFAERGFENVTVAEVAEAASVSMKTVFNYFATKEDLVFSEEGGDEWWMLKAVRNRRPGESAIVAVHGRMTGYLRQRGLESDQPRQRAKIIANSPALRLRQADEFHRHIDRLSALLAEESGVSSEDPEPRLAATMIVDAFSLLWSVVQRQIADGRPAEEVFDGLPEYAERAFALLEHGLSDYAVRAAEGLPRSSA
ncbi:TetR/AcrR family transcriptional regulator [Actinomadura sp. HBU206391]|uniref:TetR/AcrR family transcriptional regulator n=1 Tax=Actinomadura sp. HBU206391 TaxID=2731692 RepID=UPI00164EEF92|nr:TetR/AcrR family transcriptional regulator [Actinomadura sp. HBU206391]MBC6456903.1 TetR family transcriptional regulator [Actinomadura sp. HBU206391]